MAAWWLTVRHGPSPRVKVQGFVVGHRLFALDGGAMSYMNPFLAIIDLTGTPG